MQFVYPRDPGFLLKVTKVPRKIKDNGYAKLFFGGEGGITRCIYCGLCETK